MEPKDEISDQPVPVQPVAPESQSIASEQSNPVGYSPAPSPSGGIPFVPTPPEEQPFYKKFSLKLILLGLLAVAVLIGGVFGLTRLLGKKPLEPVNLTWWGLWEDETIVAPLIADYQKQAPHVKVTYVRQSPQDYRERLTSAMARGNGPDIFRFHNTWVPMLAGELATIPGEVIDEASFANTFYKTALQDLIANGKIIGMPLAIDGLGLYVNEEIFNAANISFPTTWDELRRAAISLTAKDGEGNIEQAGVALGTVSNVDHWQDILSLMLLQNGVDFNNLSDKKTEDALSFYTIFAAIDKIWDDSLPPSTSAFAAGKLAMYFAPSWRVFEVKTQNPSLSFKIIPVPQLPKSSPQQQDITWSTYWVEGIWARSKNTLEAAKFIKFLSEKENLQKLYTNSAQTRLFGEPYSRVDMAELLKEDPMVGAYVKQAPNAASWYLASATHDGPTGINSRISKYFKDAINKILAGDQAKDVLETVAQGINQVLSSYTQK